MGEINNVKVSATPLSYFETFLFKKFLSEESWGVHVLLTVLRKKGWKHSYQRPPRMFGKTFVYPVENKKNKKIIIFEKVRNG